jgi:hypothetical protein
VGKKRAALRKNGIRIPFSESPRCVAGMDVAACVQMIICQDFETFSEAYACRFGNVSEYQPGARSYFLPTTAIMAGPEFEY